MEIMSKRITRRKFVRKSLTGLGGLAAGGALAARGWAADSTPLGYIGATGQGSQGSQGGQGSEPIDAIIIGSGFGGAVAALRLAQAGVRTLVLERGRRWAIPDKENQNVFATVRNPDGRSTWLSPVTVLGEMPPKQIDIYTGVLDASIENGIIVSRGAGVGGGSLVYAAIMYQPTRALFDRVFGGAIDYDQMAQVYYPRVRTALSNPSPIPADILATKYYDATRYFLAEGDKAGLPNHLLDLNVFWDVVRQEIAGTRVPSAINGEFWYGNNSGAKNTLDRNYLADAEETGFVEILPLHVVDDISEGPDGRYTVACSHIDTNGALVAKQSFVCKNLFMAAGSVGTPKLLVKAKAKGTLRRLNENVGQFWGSNGDTLTVQLGLPMSAGDPGTGGPAGGVIEDFDNPKGPIIVESLPRFDAQIGTIFMLAMGIPPPVGSFSYDPATDSAKLTWPTDNAGIQQMMAAGNDTLAKLNAAVNAADPATTHAFTPPVMGNLTAHPLGGAVMGKACDTFGRVQGYSGLYVVDGALIPGSAGCTNPSLTVAAVAERCMDGVVPEVVASISKK
jgi:cholesterol oxidase